VLDIVAAGALRVRAGELPGMWILMAFVAGFWRCAENHVLHCDFQIRRFVAVHARRRAVRAPQGEGSGGMVELERLPRPGRR